MPYTCYAHDSMKKLYNSKEKDRITIPNPDTYYDYKSGRFRLARLAISPGHETYSILNNNNPTTRMVKTNDGNIYLFIPYNKPIFLTKK